MNKLKVHYPMKDAYAPGTSLRFYPNTDVDDGTMQHKGKTVRVVEIGESIDDDCWYTVECLETGWSGDALHSELVKE